MNGGGIEKKTYIIDGGISIKSPFRSSAKNILDHKIQKNLYIDDFIKIIYNL